MKTYRLNTGNRTYIAEMLDESNYILRLEDELTESIAVIPSDIIENSLDWYEVDNSVDNDELARVFGLLKPNF